MPGIAIAPTVRVSIVALLALTFGISCARRHDLSGRVLRVGYDNAPPYTSIAADGSPVGISVDLMNEAARRKHIRLQWARFGQSGFSIEDALVRGEIDLWPVIGIAKKRLEKIYIARPWLENNFFLVSRSSSPVRTPAEAAGKRVIHIDGMLAGEISGRFLTRSVLLPVHGFDKLVGPVCQGSADAAFMEARTLEAVLLDRPADCSGVPLNATSVPDAVGRAGIGASRSAATQAEELTDAIVAMAADGTFARAVDRYSSFSATETRSLVALQQAHDRSTVFYRGLWALLAVCLALGTLAVFAFRARRNAERARANEAGRVEILRRLAQGSPLAEMVTLLNQGLKRDCRRFRCAVTLSDAASGEESVTAGVAPILDSRGSQVGVINALDRHGRITAEDWKAIESTRQLAAIVAEHRRLHTELRIQARQDRLTGLANRAVFAEEIDALTVPSAHERKAVLFFFDLDRFKQVNDRFGHGAGDIYLQEAAERIAGCFGDSDLVARLGGDEFAALSENLDAAAIPRICQSVVDAFSAPFLVEGNRISGGISVGASCYPRDGITATELQRSADAALYEAKNGGRNRFAIFAADVCAAASAVEAPVLNLFEADLFEGAGLIRRRAGR